MQKSGVFAFFIREMSLNEVVELVYGATLFRDLSCLTLYASAWICFGICVANLVLTMLMNRAIAKFCGDIEQKVEDMITTQIIAERK